MQAAFDRRRPTFGYGDCIMWPFRTGSWIGPVIVQSLIALIPAVGGMALIGWALTATDRLAAGQVTVPPAGFYLRRGARVYLIATFWGVLSIALIYGGMFAFVAISFGAPTANASLFLLAFGGWFALMAFLAVATHLGFLFIVPLALEVDQHGVWYGLNPVPAIRHLLRWPKEALFAGLVCYVGWIIASLGATFCYIGVILTVGYGALVVAAAMHVYERNTQGLST